MATKTVAAPPTEFPEAPPRGDMQNFEQLFEPGAPDALRDHLQKIEDRKRSSRRRSVFVYCDIPVRPLPARDFTRFYVPDLTVAFDVDMETFRRDNGYAIAHHGSPPVLVLEVASKTTGERDYTIKREAYAGFGIFEYWRTDPSGGEWHDAPLAGDRLGPDGGYAPIPIERIGDGVLRGYSEVLRLYVCWEYGTLRFFDRVEGRYLLTQREEREGRLSESARADAAEAERDAAEAERDAAAAERDKERGERLAAEAQVRRLEERLRRLQG